MKKILSLLVVMVMVIGIIPVNAAIDTSVVKPLTFSNVANNTKTTVTNLGSVDGFDSVYNVVCSSGSTCKFNVNFTDIPATAAAGDYIHFTFYYRMNSKMPDGTTAGTTSNSFYPYKLFGATSGAGNIGYSSSMNLDEWTFVSWKTTMNAADSKFLRFVVITAANANVSIDVADFKATYIGKVTYESTDEYDVDGQINQFVNDVGFGSVNFGGNEIDLVTNPDSYSTKIEWTGTLPAVSAKDTHGNSITLDAKDIVYDGNVPKTITLKAYPLAYNKLDTTGANIGIYTINLDYYRAKAWATIGGNEITDLSACTGGEAVKLNATIYNPNGETANYIAVLGIYNGKKCLAAIPYNIAVTSTDATKTPDLAAYTLPAGDYTGCEIKTYVISPLRMFKVN